ncbi:MAG: substrate-binding domain-containing protein [Candidatus Limnocylindria bacterium]
MNARNRGRRSLRLLSIFSVAALVVACSSPGSSPGGSASSTSSGSGAASAGGSKPLIYVIYKLGTQQYFIDQAAGATEKAKQLGATIKVVNVESDANAAVTAVNDAVAAGAKGIGITVPDQQIGPAVATSAANAKIPLVATDDAIKNAAGADVPFVGFSGTAMGSSVGDKACQLLSTGGWLTDASKKVGALIIEKQDLTVITQRTDAEKAKLSGCGVKNIIDVASDSTIDGALKDTGPVITAHPDVTNWVVVGGNDESVKGALQALASAGVKPESIIGVGLGAYEACKEWKAGTPSGFKAALYISGYDVGHTAVQELFDNITKGTPLPAKAIAPTYMVDPTNWTKQQATGLCK